MKDNGSERKAEALLQKLVKEQQMIFDTVPAWIFYKDKNNRYLRVNKVFAEAMGMAREKMEGRAMTELYPKEQADAFYKDDLEVIKSGKPKTNIIEAVTVKGEIRWVRTDKVPYRDDLGNIVGIIGFAIDITEERKLRETQSRFAAIVESSDDTIVGKTLDGIITSWNYGAEKMYGYTAKEVIGRSISMLVPPERAGELPRIYEKIKRGEHVDHFETIRIKKDGTKITVSLAVSPIKNSAGGIVGASAIARDITQHKLDEEKIRRGGEEWAKTFDSIGDLLFIANREHTIIRANRACFDILKMKPEDVIGKKCYQIMHRLSRAWPECPLEKTVSDKKPHTQEIDDPAIGVPLLITTSPIFDDGGNLTGIIHLAKDISERKKYEEELRKKIRELERFQRITVGRELRMKELKAKISELESKSAERNNAPGR